MQTSERKKKKRREGGRIERRERNKPRDGENGTSNRGGNVRKEQEEGRHTMRAHRRSQAASCPGVSPHPAAPVGVYSPFRSPVAPTRRGRHRERVGMPPPLPPLLLYSYFSRLLLRHTATTTTTTTGATPLVSATAATAAYVLGSGVSAALGKLWTKVVGASS